MANGHSTKTQTRIPVAKRTEGGPAFTPVANPNAGKDPFKPGYGAGRNDAMAAQKQAQAAEALRHPGHALQRELAAGGARSQGWNGGVQMPGARPQTPQTGGPLMSSADQQWVQEETGSPVGPGGVSPINGNTAVLQAARQAAGGQPMAPGMTEGMGNWISNGMKGQSLDPGFNLGKGSPMAAQAMGKANGMNPYGQYLSGALGGGTRIPTARSKTVSPGIAKNGQRIKY
jgi:hypothetical protein